MPFPQLEPIASAPAAVSSRAACSGETPIIVRPPVSNVMQTTTGQAGLLGGFQCEPGFLKFGHRLHDNAVGTAVA